MAPALSPDESANIDRVVGLMRAAKCLLFITGAGMSADSGLPTYRGIGGLYDGRDPEENVPIEVLLSGDVFARRPELTWKYLLQVGRAGRNAKPNRGHEILAEIEKRFERVWVLTQNVDGFHHLAGSQNVIDIHGDVRRVRCVSCAFEGPAEDYPDDPLPPGAARAAASSARKWCCSANNSPHGNSRCIRPRRSGASTWCSPSALPVCSRTSPGRYSTPTTCGGRASRSTPVTRT
jgi:NAD-dependent SIR2 family protein deacetylase